MWKKNEKIITKYTEEKWQKATNLNQTLRAYSKKETDKQKFLRVMVYDFWSDPRAFVASHVYFPCSSFLIEMRPLQ